MAVLVTDIQQCTYEFGRLLYSPVSVCSLSATVANIIQSSTAVGQHTKYQIVISVVPRNSLDLDVRRFSLWTRFKDLNRLYAQMSKIHQQLYLHGTFPQFAPPKLFGKTDPAVIAERTEATTRFLNFVFNSEVLRKSKALLQFFEGVVELERHSDPTEPIAAVTIEAPSSQGASSSDLLNADLSASAEPIVHEGNTSDVTPAASIPANVNRLDEAPLLMTPSHALSAPDLPISPELRSLGPSHSSSSCLLFDFPDVPAQVAGSTSQDAVTADSLSPTICDDISDTEFHLEETAAEREHRQRQSFVDRLLPKIITSIARGSARSTNASPESSSVREDSNIYSVLGAVSLSGPPSGSSSGVGLGSLPMAPPPSIASSPSRVVTSTDKRNNYLVCAAQFISTAQKAESERAFELAFHCYKSAVNALLQGVQYERDLPKRNAVRKKTAKYLLKAEKLYRSYLSFDGSTFDVDSWLSNTIHDPSLIAFQSSNASLKKYRIIDVLPSFESPKRVFLVEDRAKGSGARYVMKLLEKLSAPLKGAHYGSACTTVPMQVPNMVQLLKFFDTDNFIILLLEHIRCGRLWDFLDEYFKECGRQIEAFLEVEPFRNDIRDQEQASTSQSARDRNTKANIQPNAQDEKLASPKKDPSHYEQPIDVRKRNAYEGKHVRFSVGGDGDEATDLTDVSAFDRFLNRTAHKASVASHDSLDSVEFSGSQFGGQSAVPDLRGIVEESSSNTSGFRSMLQDTVSSSTVDYFSITDEVDEEAPALINLSSRSDRSTSNISQNDVDLCEALESVKRRLRKGRRWKKSRRLPEALIAHWMAQLTSAVYVLHSQGIIIRDLRPENLLIDEDGNLKLTYCSQWYNVDFRASELAIIHQYSAPEVSSVTQTVTDAADRWSIGAIMYELICGQRMSSLCLHGLTTAIELPVPDCVEISFAARDLLSRLLVVCPHERLSDDDLRAHPFFSNCDWNLYDGTTAVDNDQYFTHNKCPERLEKTDVPGPSTSICVVPKSFADSLSAQPMMMAVGADVTQNSGSW